MSQAIKEFVRGMGQSLDLGATLTPTRQTNRKTQTQAIEEYWDRAGGYMRVACESVVREARNRPSTKY